MKIYLDENGCRIEDPAEALAGNVFVYSTRRGDFVFPVDGPILTLTAEDPDSHRPVPYDQ